MRHTINGTSIVESDSISSIGSKLMGQKNPIPYQNKNKKRAKTPSLRQRVSSWENLSHKQINITIYFENLSDELLILYVFNIHIKFRSNQMLIIIRSINVFFMHNLKLQKLEI